MRPSPPSRVLGFAHRGGMADAPENSLAAFTNALSAGVCALESDVWLDDAGTPVLHHGPPEKQNGPCLSLAELFASCGTTFDLSLDLKGPGTAGATIAVARAAGFDLRRLWLCGPRGSSAVWRSIDPSVRLVSDLSWSEAVLRPEPALRRYADLGLDAVNLRHGRWTPGLVHRVHSHGLLAFAWDVQHSWTVRWAVHRGVDAVYSDHVRLLVGPPLG